jgi:hypothetical protein
MRGGGERERSLVTHLGKYELPWQFSLLTAQPTFFFPPSFVEDTTFKELQNNCHMTNALQ